MKKTGERQIPPNPPFPKWGIGRRIGLWLAYLAWYILMLAGGFMLGLALGGCGVKRDPLLGPEMYEQYIPEPVVQVIITLDGDTLTDGNQ